MDKENSGQVTKRTTRASASSTPSKNTLSNQEEFEDMDKENSPQVTKRTTRASASTTPSKNTLPNQEEFEDMDKENSPQVKKRTTRASASTTPSKNTTDYRPPSLLDNLVFREQQSIISQDELFSTFPGRKCQILELLRLFGPINSSLLPIFLYGGPSSGKTSIVLHIFKHLKRPFIYASCRTCHNPRLLFESVLNQLLLHRKDSSNAYSSAKRCDKPSDFVNMLRESLMEVINSLRVNSKKSGLKESGEQGIGGMVYIIFDNMELVRDWDKDSVIISMLFKLYDILKMPEVGLIFISNNSPDTYHLNTGSVEPIPIHFPEYTEDDLYQIFLRNQRDPKLYSSFLDVVLKDSCKITRCIDELSTYFRLLFEKYCEPLSGIGRVPNQDMKSKLYMHLKPHVTPSLNEVFRVPSCLALELKENKEKVGKKRNMRRLGDGVVPDDIDFHMSVSAKYLLISTFLASRNPATLDAALFDSAGGGDNTNRKRRRK
ncbi:Origin of replication complex subunit [Thalictrum thalictroides]|uniref:Origin of replication complex subunit n=1 Tax=Thalictrum thalictroides TaxID=46969 RepID=A0A7J6VGV1_THATH|nr:Origin of replication complex subunit [Thalictrum thalictroides]